MSASSSMSAPPPPSSLGTPRLDQARRFERGDSCRRRSLSSSAASARAGESRSQLTYDLDCRCAPAKAPFCVLQLRSLQLPFFGLLDRNVPILAAQAQPPVQEVYWRAEHAFAVMKDCAKPPVSSQLMTATSGGTVSVLSGPEPVPLLKGPQGGTPWRKYTPGSYGQFCPVAMAAEIVCSRWTALVLRELLCGTTTLQRSAPRRAAHVADTAVQASEGIGGDRRHRRGADAPARRRRIPADARRAKTCGPSSWRSAIWGQRWIESSLSLKNLDPVAADVGHAPLA